MSHPRVYRACFPVLALATLVGCADTQWERAVYQGARYGSVQCQVKRNPADAPCAELLEYRRYERERNQVKSGVTQEHRP